jgi:hypothetical protein
MGGAIRSVLVLGILGAVLMLVSAGAGAYVAGQRLQKLTDAAALAGAEAIDLETYSVHGAGSAAPINSREAQARIKEVLGRAPEADAVALEDFSVSGADVHVSLSMPLDLELVGTTFDLKLHAKSHARLVYTPGGS